MIPWRHQTPGIPPRFDKKSLLHALSVSHMSGGEKSAPLEQQRARWERVATIVLAGTRNDLDVSQRDLAARLGWTRNMIANLETGRRSVTLSDFLLIATALNIPPETLLQRILRWGQSEHAAAKRS
jgi:plasmid maintenance system antidote protein VapI